VDLSRLRSDEVSDQEVIAAILSVPCHYTALTLYANKTVVNTTATNLATATPNSSQAANNALLSTSANWGELQSRGNASAWPNNGSEHTPSGDGFLWNVTTLEQQTIPAGNWSGTWTFRCTSGTCTATIYARMWKWNSGTGYTQIGSDISLGSHAYTAAAAAMTIPSTAMPAVSCATGDKLYVDFVMNIASNTSTANFAIQNGDAGAGAPAKVVTPGYAPTPTGLPLPLFMSWARGQGAA